MDRSTMINVTNRCGHSVGYAVPDNTAGLERIFASGETKSISFEELEKLSWTNGGMALLRNYLVIKNDEAVKLILGDVEPEYSYSIEDVKELLLRGNLEEILDCLDFGTEGTTSLLKDFAVQMEIPDMRIRKAIQNKTGFDITKAIEINHIIAEDDEKPEVKETKTRRVAVNTSESAKTERRTAAPKYKVVDPK